MKGALILLANLYAADLSGKKHAKNFMDVQPRKLNFILKCMLTLSENSVIVSATSARDVQGSGADE